MRYFPVFLDLRGRRALVVGQGEAASRKADALRRVGAEIVLADHYDPDLLTGCALAIGADAPDEDLVALSAEAQRRGIPVNIVDRSELCSYITPALVDRDPLIVAVSSAGSAPVLARLIRARIEAMVSPEYGRLAAFVDRYKEELRARFPDMRLRRRLLERVLLGTTAELVLAGDEAAADAEMRTLLDERSDGVTGMVSFVEAGSYPVDLLTLRAQRLLGEADTIVYDPDVDPALLDAARRDARRQPASGVAALLALVRTGDKVVRLGHDPDKAEMNALAAAGLPFDRVPGVDPAAAARDGKLRRRHDRSGPGMTDVDQAQPSSGPLTLGIDIGGTRLKCGVLDAEGHLLTTQLRRDTPKPASPDIVVSTLVDMAKEAGAFDRISIGFPGVVRAGRVMTAPNLGTPVWRDVPLAEILSQALGRPARMLNDGSVQGLGVVSGRGLECVITLGTGMGFALFSEGRLAPHLEMGQHPAWRRLTYDQYVGNAVLQEIGSQKWNRHVARAIGFLDTLVGYDTLYIGGGNAKAIQFNLPDRVQIVSNKAGITGGVKLWDPRLDEAFEDRGRASQA